MTVAALFLATMMLLPLLGVVTFNGEVNFGLYFFGVLAAMAWVHRNLSSESVKSRYGRLTKIETLRLTVHQMMRLMLAMFTLAFLTKDLAVSRLFLLTFLSVSGVFLLAANFYLPRILSFLFFRNTTYRTAVLASPEEAVRIGKWISKYRSLGVEVIGYVSEKPAKVATTLPWMGRPDQLMDVVSKHAVDQVLLDQSCVSHTEARLITERCEQMGCRARCFVDITSMLPSASVAIERDERYAFASFTSEPLENPMNRAAKRLLDIAVSLPVVLFVLPAVLLVTAIMQRLQSPGPVIYRQIRSGMNRRKFYIYKLRTMHVDNGQHVAKQATRGDSRIYPFGQFLRRTSIDELPQFLNVLSGEMSVSGPRPHLTQHDEEFAQVISSYRKRHFVKPGITGLAQSKGFRGEIAEQSLLMKRVRYDTHYVAKWSLAMDIRIIFNTIRQIVMPPPSAY
ncbi:MAG: exopolysaccharide biosynthesis polyprenyl glycosylphosphotransferase [Opitutaceae bacterium]|nr:exopolysaccharide biosynthesis polyprenyl glycosylphosphotransferase [Opitutaceae bacterium]